MKIVLLGNAGSGKSTLSRKLLEKEHAGRLSLDEIAFSAGAKRRPLSESVKDAMAFINSHDGWIVEGCYSDIVEPLLPFAEKLIFLNPGVDVCVRHCQARPWEPEKYESKQAQDFNLQILIDWVRKYESREDEYGLMRHRQLFESFVGDRIECKDTSDYPV